MIRIKKVIIENFQSHKNTELVFDEGLNVIVGPSDQGKSAVLRAIKWVLYNEPRGNEFIRQGTSGAKVTIEISNGYTITRERTSSKNRYILEDENGQTSIYEGFGNEVPLEVIKAHGMPKVILDTDIRSILNYGEQMEGPFLLSESGALRAKAIGRLTGLHIIDKVIRDTAVDLRRESQTGERLKDEIKSIDERLQEYKDLEILEGNLIKSEEAIMEFEKLLKRVERLEALKNELKENNNEYAKTKDILSRLSGLDECEEHLRNGELGLARLTLIEGIHKRVETAEAGIEEMRKVLDETITVNEGISLLEKTYEKWSLYKSLKKAVTMINEIESEHKRYSYILEETKGNEELETVTMKISDAIVRLKKYIPINEKRLSIERDIKKAENFLASTTVVIESKDIIDNVKAKLEEAARLEALREGIMSTENSIREAYKYLEKNRMETDRLLKEYTLLLRDIGKCPLCQSHIEDEKLENIIKHYEEAH